MRQQQSISQTGHCRSFLQQKCRTDQVFLLMAYMLLTITWCCNKESLNDIY